MTDTAPASKYIAEAERLERYRDDLIMKRNDLNRGTRSYLQDYETLTHSIDTAKANAAKYRAIAQERENAS
jgi:hypothetical protein